jgi:hypothetical protein
MGNLVFQATLGGQVNLVGPNTASTFNLNVPAVAGILVTTGDTGTVTNTMLATSAYTAPGTIGSGTANTGAFTTLSASSTVSGTGFSTYLASPPAIGGTAAAAGTFTTLSGTTSVTTPIVKSASSLTLQSNGTTTAVTIDTSQNVGIGTSSPAGNLQISGSGDRSLLVTGGTSGTISVQLGDSAAAGQGGMSYDNAVDALFLKSNGSERMRIDSSGNVGIGTSSPSVSLEISKGNNTALRVIDDAANGRGGYIKSTGSVVEMGTTSGVRPLVWTIDSVEKARIDTSGNLLVGTTSTPSSSNPGVRISNPATATPIFAYNGTSTVPMINFVNGNGTVGHIDTSGSNTSYVTSSDYRLKENITPMTSALAKVAQLKPVTYKWKADGSDGEGFIAHELAEICPHAVSGSKDAVDADGNPVYQGIDTSFLVATLTAAIQEAKTLIDTQAETINALTARIVALETK